MSDKELERIRVGKNVTETIHISEVDASGMTRMAKRATEVLVPRLSEEQRGEYVRYDA